MGMNLQMQEELKRLSELSEHLKNAEKLWDLLYTKRQRAEERGAELYILSRYSTQIVDAANRIAQLKHMIVEHVHALAALTDAQLHADGGDAT